jgi:hypothetical protein
MTGLNLEKDPQIEYLLMKESHGPHFVIWESVI